jgi:hypothetical protein
MSISMSKINEYILVFLLGIGIGGCVSTILLVKHYKDIYGKTYNVKIEKKIEKR